LVLQVVGFTMPGDSRRAAVRSYRTFSTLPASRTNYTMHSADELESPIADLLSAQTAASHN